MKYLLSREFLACTFHRPNSFDEKFSKDQFRNVYTMNARLIDRTSPKAMMKAEELLNMLRRQKLRLPLRNMDGSISNEFLQFTKLQANIIDEGLVQMILQWEVINNYD